MSQISLRTNYSFAMTGINFIREMIEKAKQYEANGEYLKAYRQYKDAECVAESDIDILVDFALNPVSYEEAQEYARHRRHRVWWRLSDEEKAIANEGFE